MSTNFSMNSVLTCTYRITLAKNGRCRHRRDVRIGTHGIVRCKGLVGENILLLAILRGCGCGCSVGGGHGRYRYRRVSVVCRLLASYPPVIGFWMCGCRQRKIAGENRRAKAGQTDETSFWRAAIRATQTYTWQSK